MTTLIESRSPKKRVAKIRIGKWQRSHNVFLLQIHLKSHLGIFEGNPVATRRYFIIKKKPPSIYKKRKQKEKAHQDTSSIQNDEAVGLCTDCSWEGAGVRGGLWCFRVTSDGVTDFSCALSLSSRPSSSSEMAIIDNSIVAVMLNFAFGEHRFQPCRFH